MLLQPNPLFARRKGRRIVTCYRLYVAVVDYIANMDTSCTSVISSSMRTRPHFHGSKTKLAGYLDPIINALNKKKMLRDSPPFQKFYTTRTKTDTGQPS